jgi:hypothetical protein
MIKNMAPPSGTVNRRNATNPSAATPSPNDAQIGELNGATINPVASKTPTDYVALSPAAQTPIGFTEFNRRHGDEKQIGPTSLRVKVMAA